MLFPNPVKKIIQEGRLAVGTMIVQVREAAIIQLFAQYGLDFVFIDMEHGPYSLETAADLIQVARLAGVVPLVRVGETRYHQYSAILDAGALGIMTPRVESVEQIRAINRFMKYPPEGERGFSRLAAHVDFADLDFHDYVKQANRNILNIIQIESKLAVDRLEALIAEPGVDAVVVGVDDLALSLNVPGETRNGLVEDMLVRIVEACNARGIPWGLHVPDVDRLEYWIGHGMRLAIYSSDIWMLQKALRTDVQRLRSHSTRASSPLTQLPG
jgi:2-keto-3-deoxy-L-rhamnonate aldolase RhmA